MIYVPDFIPEFDGKQIYLASPYSSPDKRVRAERYRGVLEAYADLQLAHKKTAFFNPILTSVLAQKYLPELGTEFSSWESVDKTAILHSDELWALTLDGYEKSIGVNAEIDFCYANKIPVRFLAKQDQKGIFVMASSNYVFV